MIAKKTCTPNDSHSKWYGLAESNTVWLCPAMISILYPFLVIIDAESRDSEGKTLVAVRLTEPS